MFRLLFLLFALKCAVSEPKGAILTQKVPHSYEVSIRFANRHVCNGVIISQRHILTAAHCFKQGELKFPESALGYMSIVSGAVSNSTASAAASAAEGRSHKIKNVTTQSEEKGVWHSDIAVATLESSIAYSRFEQPIKFPSEDLLESTEKAQVSTWDSPTDSPTTVDVFLISHNKCAQRLKEKYLGEHDNKICGYTVKGRGLCLNIDGSPLVHDGTVIGIGSKSEGCLNGQPDVFVNVYRNRAFIKRAMAPEIQ